MVTPDKIKNRRLKPKTITTIPILLALILGVGAYALWGGATEKAADEAGGILNNDKKTSTDESPETLNNILTPSGQTKPSVKPEDSPTEMDFAVSLSTYEQSVTTVLVRGNVTGTNSGTCTAVFAKAGEPTMRKSSSVAIETSYYYCKINVPVNSFSEDGAWSVKLQLNSGGNTVESATKNLQINR